MSEQLIFSLISSIIAVIALIISVISLRENYYIRKTSVKPILHSGNINKFDNNDNLFVCNFDYPITQEIGKVKLLYLGIKNIGKGPAMNVRILSFSCDAEELSDFKIGTNTIDIPENICTPFIVRLSSKDFIEFSFVTYTATISYDDIYGKTFYLSLRLYINQDELAVIEYSHTNKPTWREFNAAAWREIEANGFFELRTIQENVNNK